MSLFYQSTFLKALGWSLIDSLWQMGVLWLLYTLVTANGKRLNSSSRCSLAVFSVMLGLLWFGITLALNYYSFTQGKQILGIAYLIENGLPPISGNQWMPLLSCLYIMSVLFYAGKWVFEMVQNRNVYNQRLQIPDQRYEFYLDQLKQLAGVTRNIRLWLSENITTPVTFGFLKPVILLPVAALTQLTSKQVEALIVHEFYHIRRNDYLINVFISLCGMILFFNPFARLLISNIRKERENCCDDEVIALGYDRWEYAQALYLLGRNDITTYRFALAATGKGKRLLLERVKRMLNRSQSSTSLLKPLSMFFLCLVVAGSMSRDLSNKKNIRPEVLKADARESTTVVLAKHEMELVIPKEQDVPQEENTVEKEQAVTATDVDTPAPVEEFNEPPSPPPPPSTEFVLIDYENLVVASYVAGNIESIEFCLIEAPLSNKNIQPENCDASHPYVPASTFYFPAHEVSGIEDGKTTIQL